MALFSAKTWVDISSLQFTVCFSAQSTLVDWDFHRETAHIHDI